MQFDMGQAWNDGVAKVSANFSLLAILGGVFFFIPAVVLYLSMPELMDLAMVPGGDPETMKRALEGSAPTFAALGLLVLIASFVGYAAMIALIGDSRRLSVAEAIAVGFRALLPLLGVLIMFLVAYFVGALVAGLIFGLVIAGLSMISQGVAYGVAIMLGIAVFVGVLLLFTRISMTMPVIAIERVLNPLTAIRRSWAMTRPVQWRLLGFYVLIFIAYIVIAMVLFMLMGLIIAAVDAPAALGFINGLVGALVAMIMSGLLVGIYRQLAGPSTQAVRETFD